MLQIAIIGGGASGLSAAVSAAHENPKARIVIYEKKEKIGKKILATGNGRCNLTNRFMEPSCYYSEEREMIHQVLSRFGYSQTLDFFRNLGLITRNRGDYVYPRSDQAVSVVQAFQNELSRCHIKIITDISIKTLQKIPDGFRFSDGSRMYSADKVILACGGKASSALGSDGSGYVLAEAMGHSLVPVAPALVQLKVKNHPFQKAAGVRTSARVSAYVSGRETASDEGELQLTAYGISGIPVFQISRFISRALLQGQRASVVIDFAPELNAEELTSLFYELQGRCGSLSSKDFLNSIFPDKLIPCLLKQANIPLSLPASKITGSQIDSLVKICKSIRLEIFETTGFEHAQVCAGGVRTSQVNPYTMESLKAEGLYITGELLDVDGICGGYNLQWAWATGWIAGAAAARKSS